MTTKRANEKTLRGRIAELEGELSRLRALGTQAAEIERVATELRDNSVAALAEVRKVVKTQSEENARLLMCETRAVLAGAYKGGPGDRSRLTHAVVVWPDGTPVTVMCRTVALDSLADPHACDVNAEPTCDRCRASDQRAVWQPRPHDPPGTCAFTSSGRCVNHTEHADPVKSLQETNARLAEANEDRRVLDVLLRAEGRFGRRENHRAETAERRNTGLESAAINLRLERDRLDRENTSHDRWWTIIMRPILEGVLREYPYHHSHRCPAAVQMGLPDYDASKCDISLCLVAQLRRELERDGLHGASR